VTAGHADFSQQEVSSCTKLSFFREDIDGSELSLLQVSLDVRGESLNYSISAALPRTSSGKKQTPQPLDATRLAAAPLALKTSSEVGQNATIQHMPVSRQSSLSADQSPPIRLLSKQSADHKQTLALTLTSAGLGQGKAIAAIVLMAVLILALIVILTWNADVSPQRPSFPPTQQIITSAMEKLAKTTQTQAAAGMFCVSSTLFGQQSPIVRDAMRSGSPLLPVRRPTLPLQGPKRQGSSSSIPHICPALILPGNDAPLFRVPVSSIKQLQSSGNDNAAEILGPSGRPLLHARCIRTASHPGIGKAYPDMGPWLEVSTTPKSRHPHATIGPLQDMQGYGEQALAIYGPGCVLYGSMGMQNDVWRVNYQGEHLFRIVGPGPDYLLCATSLKNENIATMVKSEGGKDSLVLRANPGEDVLLAMTCMLAVTIKMQSEMQSAK